MRFLYAVIALLVIGIGWQGWSYHRMWHFLETESVAQSYGATPDKAKVTIIAFMNYTSRPSKEVNPIAMQTVLGQPDTRIIFHVIPSSKLAVRASSIALAAARQHKFIEMHEQLMLNEKPLTDDTIKEMATKIKIDPDQLLKDAKSPEVVATLRKEIAAQKQLKIRMSPLFIFNRKWIYGPNSLEALPKDMVDLIKKAKGT